ncbi:hypothetical protein PORY_002410 [Pneumocystis oryctolagi]|uniref:Uncharacterized protein n=1 Tax=Pneumocystis oryctolagi TaxID=42067 RepID=A0ACB7CBN2_9ASCO|nr:hypothetical protein PORY_002410 [Pneumocystis oryctolagi]
MRKTRLIWFMAKIYLARVLTHFGNKCPTIPNHGQKTHDKNTTHNSSGHDSSTNKNNNSTEISKSNSSSKANDTHKTPDTFPNFPDIYKSIDILKPITTRPPLCVFSRQKHPLQPLSIHGRDLEMPIQTNKFYANFFLGTQMFASYSDPYVLTWVSGDYSGVTVSHVDDYQKVFSTDTPPSYFINPLGIFSVVFSADELNNTNMTLTSLDHMSVNVIATPKNCTKKKMEMPIVKGMAYVTANYSNLTPAFTSVVGFQNIQKAKVKNNKYCKFIITLYDQKRWLLYAFPKNGSSFNLEIRNNTLRTTTGPFNGIIQVTKVPVNNTNAECILDASAGTYAKKVILSARVNGSHGVYSFFFDSFSYNNRPLLHYAMYHHMCSFDNDTASRKTNVSLPSTTNGLMVAYTGELWTMLEDNLPVDIDFLPYSFGKNASYSQEALKNIKEAAQYEISQDFKTQLDTTSIYFSGKVLAKISLICFVASSILKNETLADECVKKFNESYMPFVKNQNQFKLVYETTWKGIVSNRGFTEVPLADFGASYYNDHHFHYGYMIFAAAVIGHIRPQWIKEVKEWAIDLIRDVSNPVDDLYFPAFRTFDWFTGHSWAKGLFESPDGKDEESSSEDYNFYFAMKLLGIVIGDDIMVARANLMLAIMKRSFRAYFLYEQSNSVMPKIFLPNYVAGIKFMNKVHHTTYFSTRLECIQGIHMLPITSISAYIRTPSFVQSEWDNKLASIIDTIEDGWKGILYANFAISNPKKSYCFFSKNFNRTYLDNGASLTWYLAYSSAFANSRKS